MPTASGATAVQVVYKRGSEIFRIEHIGSAHTALELDLLIAKAHEHMDFEQPRLDLFPCEPAGFTEGSYSKLLWDALSSQYDSLGFTALEDEVFRQLVVARMIEPTSKADTIRVLAGLGLEAPSNTGIHRCLKRIIDEDYRSTVSACCLERASARSLTLLLYDVTTLYFEVQKEDGYRKPGMSKERRLEPQITVGLLVGRDGFPLEVRSFEGNRAEVKTVMEVLDGFKARYGLAGMTVTADAAMLSSANIQALEDAGYHYIIGSRIAKTPWEIAEYARCPGAELEDGRIFDLAAAMNTGKGQKRVTRRVVYQYRAKRAAMDLRNIDRLLSKAQGMVDGKTGFKRNRFLKVEGAARAINHELVAEARLKAGIKGYVTDLDIPAQEVIDAYHQLFEVERSFRMAKSDLLARPVFHRKRDSIEAHLTIVFAALAISRRMQEKTGMTIRRLRELLAPLRTSAVSINGTLHEFPPRLDEATLAVLRSLDTGIW
ncbi:MAG: IS1634 family transposase [Coriobacteriia bacterium]